MKINSNLIRVIVLWAITLLTVAVLFAAAVLESGVLTPRLIAHLNERLKSAGELRVSTGDVYWRPWSGLILNDLVLEIPRDFSGSLRSEPLSPGFSAIPHPHILRVKKVEVGYRFSGLFRGTPTFQGVKLEEPEIDLHELSRWNARLAELRGDAVGSEEDEVERAAGVRTVAVLGIEDLEIKEGRVKGTDGTLLSGLWLAGGLEASGSDLRLKIDTAGAKLTTIDEMIEVTGALALVDGALVLEGLHLGAAEGRVSFEGRLDPWGPTKSNLLTSGYAIPLSRIGKWIDVEHPLLTGNLEFRFRTSGRPDSLQLKGSLRSVDAGGVGREAKFDAERFGESLRLNSFRLTVDESTLDLSGHFVLSDPPQIDGIAIFGNLDPATLLADADLAILQDLEGAVRFEGVGMSRETFDGSTVVEIARGSLFDLSLDSASIRARMSGGELRLDDVLLVRGDSRIQGDASIDRENALFAEFEGTIADLADLGDLSDKTPSEVLEGSATAKVSASGPLVSPDLEAVLVFENAKVLGAQAKKLEIDLKSQNLGRDAVVSLVAKGEEIGYGKNLISRGFAEGTWSQGTASVTNLRFESDKRGELRVKGDLDVTREGRLTGQIAELEIRSPEEEVRWVNDGPIQIEKDPESLKFSGLNLLSGSGYVSSDISVQETGEMFIRANGSGVDLAVFSPFLLLPEPIGGLLEFEANAVVGADTLWADADLTLRDGRYGDDTLELIEGRLHVRDDRIVVDDLAFRSSFARAALNGDATLSEGDFRSALADSAARSRLLDRLVFEQFDASFQSPDLDRVHEVFPAIPSPGGRGTLQARIDGSSAAPVVQYEAELIGGRLGVESLDAFQATGSFNGNVLTVDSARFECRGGTLTTHGHLPVRWSLASLEPEFTSGGSVNMEFVSERFPSRALTVVVPLFELTDGRVDSVGRLAGHVDDLYLEGEFTVAEGVLTIPTFDDPLIGGELAGTFSREGVQLAEGRFVDGAGGVVTGKGHLVQRNLGPQSMAVDVKVKDYHYSGVAGIRGVGDGRLAITLRDQSGKKIPEFNGDFQVTRLDLDERILLPPEASDGSLQMPPGVTIPVESTRRRDAQPLGPPAPLILAKLDFTADNNAWLRTEEIDVEMAGHLTLFIEEEYFGVTGLVRSLRGTYSVLNTEFDIEKAEIEFNDPADVTTSYIDAVATTRVGDEDITAFVTGPVIDPVIDLQSDSPLTTAEIYELLLLRRDAAVEREEGPVSKAFRNSVLTRLATQFGRDFVRELGFDTFDLEVQGEGTTNLGVGKRFSSEFFVQYKQQVRTNPDDLESEISSSLEGPERQLLLEYRLSEIFQLQVEQGKIAGEEYFTGDLWAEWGY